MAFKNWAKSAWHAMGGEESMSGTVTDPHHPTAPRPPSAAWTSHSSFNKSILLAHISTVAPRALFLICSAETVLVCQALCFVLEKLCFHNVVPVACILWRGSVPELRTCTLHLLASSSNSSSNS